jgi:hypothetical protein
MSSASWSTEYENQNNGPSIIETCVLMTVVASLFLGLRLWARRMKGLGLQLDDWILLVAMVSLEVKMSGQNLTSVTRSLFYWQ